MSQLPLSITTGRTAAAMAAVLAMSALGACTRSADSDDDASAHGPGSQRTKPVHKHDRTPEPSGDNGGLKHPVGAIRELTDVSCTALDGIWSASATLTNAGDRTSMYLVSFSVVKRESSTVQDSVQKKVRLTAGQTIQIDVPDFFESHRKGLACVPRVVKGDAN